MHYRTLGRTGLRVSEIGFGGISVGRPRWGVAGPGDRPELDEAEAIRAIYRALDLGINFFDTAPNYGNRESERVLGKALKGRRDQCLIATKCGHFFSPEKSYIKDHAPELSARSIDDSLRTMGIETLDLIQIHSAPPEVVAEYRRRFSRRGQRGKINPGEPADEPRIIEGEYEVRDKRD